MRTPELSVRNTISVPQGPHSRPLNGTDNRPSLSKTTVPGSHLSRPVNATMTGDSPLFDIIESYSFFNGAEGSVTPGSIKISVKSLSVDAGLTIKLKKPSFGVIRFNSDLKDLPAGKALKVQFIISSPDNDWTKDRTVRTVEIVNGQTAFEAGIPEGTDKINFIAPGNTVYDLEMTAPTVSLSEFDPFSSSPEDTAIYLSSLVKENKTEHGAAILCRLLKEQPEKIEAMFRNNFYVPKSLYTSLAGSGELDLIDSFAGRFFPDKQNAVFSDTCKNIIMELESSRSKRNIAGAALYTAGHLLDILPYSFRDDELLVMTAIYMNNSNIRFASDRLKDDRVFIMKVIERFRYAFQYIPEKLRDDKEIVLLSLAVNKNIQHVSERLRDDEDVVLLAFEAAWEFVASYVSERLINDASFCVRMFGASGSTASLCAFPQTIRDNQDFQVGIAGITVFPADTDKSLKNMLRTENVSPTAIELTANLEKAVKVLTIDNPEHVFPLGKIVSERYKAAEPLVRSELEGLLGKEFFNGTEQENKKYAVLILPDSKHDDHAFYGNISHVLTRVLNKAYKVLYYNVGSDKEFGREMQNIRENIGAGSIDFLYLNGHGDFDRTRWGDWVLSKEEIEEKLGTDAGEKVHASLVRSGYIDATSSCITGSADLGYLTKEKLTSVLDGIVDPAGIDDLTKELIRKNWLYLKDYPFLSEEFRRMSSAGTFDPSSFGMTELSQDHDQLNIFYALERALKGQYENFTSDIDLTFAEKKAVVDMMTDAVNRSYIDIKDAFLRTDAMGLMANGGLVGFCSCSVGSDIFGTTPDIDNNVEFAHSVWPNAWALGAKKSTYQTDLITDRNGTVTDIKYQPWPSLLIPPDSTTSVHEIEESKPNIPVSMEISNYPNPFSTGTTLVFNGNIDLKDAEVKIFNLLGKEVYSFRVPQGFKSVKWNPGNLPNGSYFAILTSNGQSYRSKVMSLVR